MHPVSAGYSFANYAFVTLTTIKKSRHVIMDWRRPVVTLAGTFANRKAKGGVLRVASYGKGDKY